MKLKKNFDKQKLYADKKKKDIKFHVGEKILIKTNVKKTTFSGYYDRHMTHEGTHTVVKIINLVTYLVEVIKNRKKYIEQKFIHQIK